MLRALLAAPVYNCADRNRGGRTSTKHVMPFCCLVNDLQQRVRDDVQNLCEKADAAEFPASEALLDLVYAEGSHVQ